MACPKLISFLMLAMAIFLSSSKIVAAGRNLETGTPDIRNFRFSRLTPTLPKIPVILPQSKLSAESDTESKSPSPTFAKVPVSEIQPLSRRGIRSSVDPEAESPDVLYFEFSELAPSFPEITIDPHESEQSAESDPPLPAFVETPVPGILPHSGPVPQKIVTEIL